MSVNTSGSDAVTGPLTDTELRAADVAITLDGETVTLAANSGVDIGDVDVISSALPTGAATEATLATIDADTSTLAGAVAGAEMQVDIVTGPTGANALETQGTAADGNPAAGNPIQIGGVDGAGNVQALLCATGGALTTTLGSSLPAGTAAIGKLAANSGVDIGDVTINNVATAPALTSVVPISATANSPSRAATTAYAASLVANAAAGTLYTVMGYNSGPAQWIQVHNTTALPADTSVPIHSFKVSSDANFTLDLGTMGDYFSTGITIANSTTGPTLTTGAADCWIVALYLDEA